MIYTIENEKYIAQVSDMGAELQSLKRKADGFEYIWQGDAAVWSGRAPLLFPFVGRLKGEGYEHEGVHYPMTKHGFSRKSVFEAAQESVQRLTMRIQSPMHKIVYPFDYVLEVAFELKEDGLKVTHRVTNNGKKSMYFSIGAHPGFNCAMGDWIEFAEDEQAWAYRLGEGGLLSDEPVDIGVKDHRLVVDEEVFKKDALIFMGLRSDEVTLFSGGKPHVTVEYGSAPCLGIWAKPGASYVCIEPWYGVDDGASATGVLKEKKQIVHLGAGECFRFPMKIRLH